MRDRYEGPRLDMAECLSGFTSQGSTCGYETGVSWVLVCLL